MQFAVMIAAAFIIATVAVAVLSPLDNLPQRARQHEQTATATAAPDESGAAEEATNDDAASDDDTSSDGDMVWPAGEEPPP